jgi:hypothetical protein
MLDTSSYLVLDALYFILDTPYLVLDASYFILHTWYLRTHVRTYTYAQFKLYKIYKGKVVQIHAMEALWVGGGVGPTLS